MNESPIGVIDSGIGGSSILKDIIKILPNERFVYLVDTKNMPYGNKSKRKIYKIVQSNVDYLIAKFHIKMLVVACNTASSACSEKLRKKLNIPVVCIEPPIKPAIECGYKKILILATKSTLRNNLTIRNNIKLIKRKNRAGDKIIIKKLAIKKLAGEIDKNFNNFDAIQELLNKKLRKFQDYEALVIGCTHYNFIKDQISAVLPDIRIISCELAVAKRVKYILERSKVSALSKTKLKNLVLLTKPNFRLKKFIENYLTN